MERERKYEEFRVQASLQGVDVGNKEEEDYITRRKRELMGDDPDANDIATLIQKPVLQQGMDFELGLGYELLE